MTPAKKHDRAKPSRWAWRPSLPCLLFGHQWHHDWSFLTADLEFCNVAWGTCRFYCHRCKAGCEA